MAINSGILAADGSYRVTVVNGVSYTGVFAADGSFNVVSSPGSAYVGAYHPCGAWWVTLQSASTNSIRAADGSLNVSVTTYQPGTQYVTVVGGQFNTTTGTPPNVAVFIGRF